MKKILFLIFTLFIFQSNAYHLKNCTDESLEIRFYRSPNSSHGYKSYLVPKQTCVIIDGEEFIFIKISGKFLSTELAFVSPLLEDEIAEIYKEKDNQGFNIRKPVLKSYNAPSKLVAYRYVTVRAQ